MTALVLDIIIIIVIIIEHLFPRPLSPKYKSCPCTARKIALLLLLFPPSFLFFSAYDALLEDKRENIFKRLPFHLQLPTSTSPDHTLDSIS